MKAWVVGLTALAITVVSAELRTSAAQPPTHEQVSQVTEFLFVQNALSGSFEDGRLTFEESGPVIFFSDRPYRIFGHTDPEHFIDSWGTGANSFAEDPPNAVLSLLGKQVESFSVVLSDPKVENGAISYAVQVEEGTIPSKFGYASLFIDNDLWAAVGGLAVGRMSARRQSAREAAAYKEGQATAKQDQNSYYQAQPAHQPASPPAAASPPATASAPPASKPSAEQQLEELKQLLDKGLISQDDYDKKKEQILKNL